jgi:hypothetical protein
LRQVKELTFYATVQFEFDAPNVLASGTPLVVVNQEAALSQWGEHPIPGLEGQIVPPPRFGRNLLNERMSDVIHPGVSTCFRILPHEQVEHPFIGRVRLRRWCQSMDK